MTRLKFLPQLLSSVLLFLSLVAVAPRSHAISPPTITGVGKDTVSVSTGRVSSTYTVTPATSITIGADQVVALTADTLTVGSAGRQSLRVADYAAHDHQGRWIFF